MKNEISNIIKFLNLSKIEIDEKEFQFQFETHPNYPSLLAVSDTLTFFRIENLAFKISIEDLENMPNYFLALIQRSNELEGLSLITKDKEKFLINNESLISRTDFEKVFKGIVLLAEKSKNYEDFIIKNKISNFKKIIISLIIFYVLFNGFENFNWLFQILSFFGIYLSFETFNQSIGINNGISSKFCTSSPKTSCESVLKSNKWKIFKFLSLSDVSIVFFVSQLLLIIGFTLTNNFLQLISFTSNFIWFSIPMILVSVYYQKYIEKKWCPLCLVISGVLIIETILVYNLVDKQIKTIEIKELLSIIGIIYIVAISWIYIKNIIVKKTEYKNQLSKAIRFKRDYQLFKEQLLKTDKLIFPKNNYSISYGNENANCQITLLSSPFCGHCKKTHTIFNDLFIKYENKIGFHIIYNTDIDEENPFVKVIKNLQQLFIKEGLNRFEKELNQFYNSENYSLSFLEKTKQFEITEDVYQILKLQNEFSLTNNLNFTPMIFINGYKFPDIYEREDIFYFINDLIDDEF
jgi:hypothetical protein